MEDHHEPEVGNSLVLLLDERIMPNGTHARTWASYDGQRVKIRDEAGSCGELSPIAIDRVMCRYGRLLDCDIALDGDSLPCGTFTLRRLRHHAAIDAEARDYLVWERPGDESLVCLATTATAALRFLVARLSSATPSGI
jgi:hypothetical protein